MLGGVRTQLSQTDDLDNVKSNGVYCWDTMSHKPANAPTDAGSTLEVITREGTGTSLVWQKVYSYSGPIYVRRFSSNAWSSWQQVYDTSLLTNSALLSPLASALGGLIERTPSSNDTNDIKTTGCYFNNAWTNGPESITEGVIINILGKDYGTQFDSIQLFFDSANKLYFRVHWWGSWKTWVSLSVGGN